MEASAIAATTRLYTEMGSVFAKMLTPGNPCIVFSYDPAAARVKAKTAKLSPPQRALSWVLRTGSGSYTLGPDQAVRTLDGQAVPVRDLKVGTELHSCELQNADGDIFLVTGQGAMIPLHQLIEQDLETGFPSLSLASPSSYRAGIIQTVLEVGEGAPSDVHPFTLDCPSPRDRSAASGHNFLLWPDGTSFGSGIFAY